MPHRQYLVRTINGIAYINDPKATNAARYGERALACYRRIYWILGGQPKEGGLTGLDEFLPRIEKAYLIGDAAQDLVHGFSSGMFRLNIVEHWMLLFRLHILTRKQDWENWNKWFGCRLIVSGLRFMGSIPIIRASRRSLFLIGHEPAGKGSAE